MFFTSAKHYNKNFLQIGKLKRSINKEIAARMKNRLKIIVVSCPPLNDQFLTKACRKALGLQKSSMACREFGENENVAGWAPMVVDGTPPLWRWSSTSIRSACRPVILILDACFLSSCQEKSLIAGSMR